MRVEITTEIRLVSDRGDDLVGESFEIDTRYTDKWAVKNAINALTNQLWNSFNDLLKQV